MVDKLELERAQREEIRWRILVGIDAGRPYAVAETILYRLLHDIKLPISGQSLRKELDYLRERKLIEITDQQSSTWLVSLTRHGVDFVEYTIDAEPGIARPPRWA